MQGIYLRNMLNCSYYLLHVDTQKRCRFHDNGGHVYLTMLFSAQWYFQRFGIPAHHMFNNLIYNGMTHAKRGTLGDSEHVSDFAQIKELKTTGVQPYVAVLALLWFSGL